jgi:cytochrome c
MLSRRIARAALVVGGFVLAGGGTAGAQERATPQEVIKKVQVAAQELAKSGEAGLPTYSSRNPASVWKDSYIFVLSCKGGSVMAVANPVRPDLKGKPLAQIVTFGPKSGEQIANNFCAAGRQPHGGWVEYNFPKPGQKQPTRKVSYLLAAQGTPYVVGAGIYDEKAKLKDLTRLVGGQ